MAKRRYYCAPETGLLIVACTFSLRNVFDDRKLSSMNLRSQPSLISKNNLNKLLRSFVKFYASSQWVSCQYFLSVLNHFILSVIVLSINVLFFIAFNLSLYSVSLHFYLLLHYFYTFKPVIFLIKIKLISCSILLVFLLI